MRIPSVLPSLSAIAGVLTSRLELTLAIDSQFEIAPQLRFFYLADIGQGHRIDYFKPFGPFVAG
jgi:hypothetical protein